jgi:hypothetical protein
MSFVRYDPCPNCRERGKDSRGDNLSVWSDGGVWCFACGYKRGPPASSIWEEVGESTQEKSSKILPYDFSVIVPAKAAKWLFQFKMMYTYWKNYIGWCPSEERLVFKVGNPTLFSIGRYMGDDLSIRKWKAWGDTHKYPTPVGDGSTIVLTEDLISAHKVAHVTEAMPLFGTKIYPCHLEYLRNTGKPIILWLDKDQEDRVMKVANNISTLTGLSVDYIITDKDPKYVDYKNIALAVGCTSQY